MDKSGKPLYFYRVLHLHKTGAFEELLEKVKEQQAVSSAIEDLTNALQEVEPLPGLLGKRERVLQECISRKEEHERRAAEVAEVRKAIEEGCQRNTRRRLGRLEREENRAQKLLQRAVVHCNRTVAAIPAHVWTKIYALSQGQAKSRRKRHPIMELYEGELLSVSLASITRSLQDVSQLRDEMHETRGSLIDKRDRLSDACGSIVKKAFRKRSLKLHPDKNKHNKEDKAKDEQGEQKENDKDEEDEEESFSVVSRAYSVLSDPKQRSLYNSVADHAMWEVLFGANRAESSVRSIPTKRVLRIESGVPSKMQRPVLKVVEQGEGIVTRLPMSSKRLVGKPVSKKRCASVRVGWVVPHGADYIRIAIGACEGMRLPPEASYCNIEQSSDLN